MRETYTERTTTDEGEPVVVHFFGRSESLVHRPGSPARYCPICNKPPDFMKKGAGC